MNKKEPEKLHERTPLWFRDWHDKSFWHFKYRVESRLETHNRLLWAIIGAILTFAVAIIVRGYL